MIYDAVFFDWDGTAVYSRKASAENVCERINQLLKLGARLVIISGTTYENIACGELHKLLGDAPLDNLYLGLGRGAVNIGFRDGEPFLLGDNILTGKEKAEIDAAAFALHRFLYEEYGFPSDIVFSRPNYCKLDLMAAHDRGDQLFLQQSEIEQVQELIRSYGIEGGLESLIELSNRIGREMGLEIVTTTDAKYLEIGLTTKSDNVNFMVEHVLDKNQISVENCAFWGDEFAYLAPGVRGSDAFMITSETEGGHFFDVSQRRGRLPEQVTYEGGGVPSFLNFLDRQIEERKGK